MINVTFRHADGRETKAHGKPGQSLMQLAVQAGVAEILAECGGACACGTCHVHVEASWFPKLPAAGEGELAMIDCVEGPDAFSRLSCQVALEPAMDGLVVNLPASQF